MYHIKTHYLLTCSKPPKISMVSMAEFTDNIRNSIPHICAKVLITDVLPEPLPT